jgi:chemotaxis protein CheZ
MKSFRTGNEGRATASDEILARVGEVTRLLHNNLRTVGLDKIIEQVALKIPNTRDRLTAIEQMTEQAAERVLNSLDIAIPLQTEMSRRALQLETEWQTALLDSNLSTNHQQLIVNTQSFIASANQNSLTTKAMLMDIMLAQEFQDLTGQMMRRIADMTHEIERQLLQVLIDYSPAVVDKETTTSLINGPQLHPENTTGSLASQIQVDEFLDSLGC